MAMLQIVDFTGLGWPLKEPAKGGKFPPAGCAGPAVDCADGDDDGPDGQFIWTVTHVHPAASRTPQNAIHLNFRFR